MSELLELLKGLEWYHLVQGAGLILSVVIAQGGMVPLINRLKTRFNLQGKVVTWVVVGVVCLVTMLNMIVQGIITPEALTTTNVIGTFLLLLERTQAEYLRIKNTEKGENELG